MSGDTSFIDSDYLQENHPISCRRWIIHRNQSVQLTFITHHESSVETVAARIQDGRHMWQEQKTMMWKENTSPATF